MPIGMDLTSGQNALEKTGVVVIRATRVDENFGDRSVIPICKTHENHTPDFVVHEAASSGTHMRGLDMGMYGRVLAFANLRCLSIILAPNFSRDSPSIDGVNRGRAGYPPSWSRNRAKYQ